MFPANILGFHYLTFAASPTTPVINDCIIGGMCAETNSSFDALKEVITDLLKYFFEDIDGIYQAALQPCQLIAGLGALYLLLPIMVDYGKNDYVFNMKKIVLLFMLMLMFANNGSLGRSIAVGNYAFIQGIHGYIAAQLGGNTNINAVKNNFKNDKQKVLKINTQLLRCNSIERTKVDTSNNVISNPVFVDCEAQLRNLINTAGFSTLSTTTNFVYAVSKADFEDMATGIRTASTGFGNMPSALEENSEGIHTLLIGWRAAVALLPDIALIAALLYFPFPLAFSFLSTSYLQAWFSSLWSVGLFKFAMTIFDPMFAVIEAKFAGSMPQDTLDLAMGIAAPSIAIALATGSGLGLSGLISQGVSNLSSRLTSTPPGTGDTVRNIPTLR